MHALVLMSAVLSTLSAEPTPAPARAQADTTANAAPAPDAQRTFGEFLVIRKNGDRIEGHDGSLLGPRLTGISSTGERVDLLSDDIKTLYSKQDSKAGEMALWGGGVGLAFASAVLLRISNDPADLFRTSGNATVSLTFLGGSTLLGALIGLGIGSGLSNWRIEPVVVPGRQYSARLSLSL